MRKSHSFTGIATTTAVIVNVAPNDTTTVTIVNLTLGLDADV